jgi:hypothetical protein
VARLSVPPRQSLMLPRVPRITPLQLWRPSARLPPYNLNAKADAADGTVDTSLAEGVVFLHSGTPSASDFSSSAAATVDTSLVCDAVARTVETSAGAGASAVPTSDAAASAVETSAGASAGASAVSTDRFEGLFESGSSL